MLRIIPKSILKLKAKLCSIFLQFLLKNLWTADMFMIPICETRDAVTSRVQSMTSRFEMTSADFDSEVLKWLVGGEAVCSEG